MMDSQENAIEMGKKEEVNKMEETAVPTAEATDQTELSQVENTQEETTETPDKETERKVYTSKKEVLERIREMKRQSHHP